MVSLSSLSTLDKLSAMGFYSLTFSSPFLQFAPVSFPLLNRNSHLHALKLGNESVMGIYTYLLEFNHLVRFSHTWAVESV